MSSIPPLLFNTEGPIPTPPAVLNNNLITQVEAAVPGYTARLPGSMIDDMSGTGTGILVSVDQARVDAVNGVASSTANPYVLNLLGQQAGLALGTPSNGSALEVFSGTPGYVIPAGFLVGDGTNQYAVQDGTIIAGGGSSPPVEVVATNPNTFPIPANSITQVITSTPGGTITCTNPSAGVAAQQAETVESYRSRLQTAQQFALQGGPTVLKTLLYAVPGVNPRLVSILLNGTKWEVICGGGDPTVVAGAIYAGVSTPGLLVGSSTGGRNVTETVVDAPNSYSIVYVNPPQQEVTIAVTWNTTLSSFTAAAAVNQYIIQAVTAYINSIIVGGPINLMVMTDAIQDAVAPVLSETNLTTLSFVVKYSGVTQSPSAGTSIIPAPDAETYLQANAGDVTSAQG